MRSTVFTSKSPSLDLHGERPDTIEVIINDFINYNAILGNKYISIVHGKGSGAIKNKTYDILKNNSRVLDFKLNNWNTGETIVHLDNEKNLH